MKQTKKSLPQEKKPKKPYPWKRLLFLLLITAVLLAVHIVAVEMAVFGSVVSIVVFWLYYGALAALGAFYIIYNRAFTRDNIRPEELPEDWSEEKKREFFASRDERKLRSRPVLTVLFALIVVFIYEMIVLFFGDAILSAFGGGKV
jgi:hypothetical protein